MRIFLSWSGAASRALAEQLRDWLPAVMQAVEPWMSAEDIDKGARWSTDIAAELQQAKVGVICVTKANQHEPWIQFEAGALSKTLEKTYVIPYLLDMKPADLKGPLVQFQAAVADEADTFRLVRTINRAMGDEALPEPSVEKFFKKWWPELANAIKQIPVEGTPAPPTRSDRDILEEMLALLRNVSREPAQQVVEVQPHRFVPRGPDGRIVKREIVYKNDGPVERVRVRYPDREEIVEMPFEGGAVKDPKTVILRRLRRPEATATSDRVIGSPELSEDDEGER